MHMPQIRDSAALGAGALALPLSPLPLPLMGAGALALPLSPLGLRASPLALRCT